MRKSTQLQLRTLFQSHKKQTAAAAAAASERQPGDPPPPPTTVPVIAVNIKVTKGALKSAYMAVNKPLPRKRRHTWMWTPGGGSKRKENSNAVKTMGHQLGPDGEKDPSLGPTGCVFDMHAASTDYFAVGQYYLTLDAMSDKDIFGAGVEKGSYKGGTEVEVTASITMRTMSIPAKPVLKTSGVKTRHQQEEIEQKQAEFEAKQAEKRHRAEEERAEEEARRKEINDEYEAQAGHAKPVVIAAADPNEPDPFSDDTADVSVADRKYDASAAHVAPPSADDPFADSYRSTLLDGPDSHRDLVDPFASLTPTPTNSGRRPIIPTLNLTNKTINTITPTRDDTPKQDEEQIDSTRTDVLVNVDAPQVALSPDLLSTLPSNAPTPRHDDHALSLAATPVIKPVRPDARVLDGLADELAGRPSTGAARVPASLLGPADLNVPFDSLPPRPTTAKVDLLAQEVTPRVSPRREQISVSQMPSPVHRPPKPDAAVLDRVNAMPALPTRDMRVLDDLPTPKLQATSPAVSIDAMPGGALPPVTASIPVRTAPPVAPSEAADFLNSPDARARKKKVKAGGSLPPAVRLPSVRPVQTVGGSMTSSPAFFASTPPTSHPPSQRVTPRTPTITHTQPQPTHHTPYAATFSPTPTPTPRDQQPNANTPPVNPLDELFGDEPDDARPQYDENALDDL